MQKKRIECAALGRRYLSLPSKPIIGFIGLGQMGFPMAANLRNKTSPIADPTFHVFDVSQKSVDRFCNTFDKASSSSAGATPSAAAAATSPPSIHVHTSPKSLARVCDIIVTMLPAGPHVRSVYTHAETGLLAGVKERKRDSVLLIDSSTIDVKTSKEVEKAAREAGGVMLDAPVSGGTLGAEAGTLTFMVGSPSLALFNLAKESALVHMGKNIVHCGEVGNGQVAKICNNMLLGISMIAASETMNLGVKLGMDPKLLASILNTSSGRCWSTDTYNPCPGVLPNVPSSRDYTGGFGSSLMSKDLSLAVSAAKDANAAVILGAVASQVYEMVSGKGPAGGLGDKDFSVVYKWLGGDCGSK